MAVTKSRKPPPASGSVTLTDSGDGRFSIQVGMTNVDGVDTDVLGHIQAAANGLAYFYETNHEEVDTMGQAFLFGLNRGLHIAKSKNMTKKGPVGFHDHG